VEMTYFICCVSHLSKGWFPFLERRAGGCEK